MEWISWALVILAGFLGESCVYSPCRPHIRAEGEEDSPSSRCSCRITSAGVTKGLMNPPAPARARLHTRPLSLGNKSFQSAGPLCAELSITSPRGPRQSAQARGPPIMKESGAVARENKRSNERKAADRRAAGVAQVSVRGSAAPVIGKGRC